MRFLIDQVWLLEHCEPNLRQSAHQLHRCAFLNATHCQHHGRKLLDSAQSTNQRSSSCVPASMRAASLQGLLVCQAVRSSVVFITSANTVAQIWASAAYGKAAGQGCRFCYTAGYFPSVGSQLVSRQHGWVNPKSEVRQRAGPGRHQPAAQVHVSTAPRSPEAAHLDSCIVADV